MGGPAYGLKTRPWQPAAALSVSLTDRGQRQRHSLSLASRSECVAHTLLLRSRTMSSYWESFASGAPGGGIPACCDTTQEECALCANAPPISTALLSSVVSTRCAA